MGEGKKKRLHQNTARGGTQFSKVTGDKINVQKLVAFVHTNNKAAEKEIKESILFAIAPKTIRYLGINLTKEVKALYTEHLRKLLKEIEEDAHKKGKTFHAYGLEDQILLKCLYYPKQSAHAVHSLSK